ncbi:MAG: hypothetical protein R6V86_12375 [Spirochaetia bacterium]
MKRILNKTIILAIGLMLVGGAAFGIDFNIMKDSFSDFSDGVAEALPQASTTGLTWSDARVRGFPHFGVGLSFGAVMMPSEAFEKLAGPEGLNVDLPSGMVGDLGVPFPAYAIDGRVGIPFLPFDIGAKLGLLTPGMSESLGGDTSADYMLAGFDIRYPILKGRLLMPAVSVSTGYNYLSGGINTSVSGADLSAIDGAGGDLQTELDQVTFNDPNLRFAWKTHSLDFKVQASKNLLIFTPYAGGAYTYGWSQAGGGIAADIDYGSSSASDVQTALEAAGYEGQVSDQSFTILSGANGGSVRAFGGFSVNLLILKLDLNGQYNFTTKSVGGGINARVQL